jgi:hypothetical protein
VPREPDSATWCARPQMLISADGPADLAAAIRAANSQVIADSLTLASPRMYPARVRRRRKPEESTVAPQRRTKARERRRVPRLAWPSGSVVSVHSTRYCRKQGLSVPLARAFRPLRPAGRGRSVGGVTTGNPHPPWEGIQANGQGPAEQDQGRPRGGRRGARIRPEVDAADITVRNVGGDVTLTGTVPSYPQYLQGPPPRGGSPG